MADARDLTGTLNWFEEAHSITVHANGDYIVRSVDKEAGKGFLAKDFFKKKAREREDENKGDVTMLEFARNLIEQMESSVRSAGIIGQSEHTVALIGTDSDKRNLWYLQLPVRVRGLGKEAKEKDTRQKTL